MQDEHECRLTSLFQPLNTFLQRSQMRWKSLNLNHTVKASHGTGKQTKPREKHKRKTSRICSYIPNVHETLVSQDGDHAIAHVLGDCHLQALAAIWRILGELDEFHVMEDL